MLKTKGAESLIQGHLEQKKNPLIFKASQKYSQGYCVWSYLLVGSGSPDEEHRKTQALLHGC